MNIVREDLAGQTALLKVTLGEADYAEKIEKALRTYRKKANVPGFRPGMVPMGMITKMYRKGALAEETYRMATDAAFEYIKGDQLNLMGDLMPAEEQKDLDFDNGTEFEFCFRIGIAPEVKLELSKNDKVENYIVVPSSEMVDGYRDNYLRRFGKLVDVDVVTKDEALSIKLENSDMTIDDAYVSLISMDEAQKAVFAGKKVGDSISVDINELYPKEDQRASILGLKPEELVGVNPQFTLTITKIREFRNPEINDEFFTMAFPDGSVKTVSEFDAFIEKQVESELSSQTSFYIIDQVRKFALAKTNLSLPEEFLKDWLFQINEGKFSMEDIDKEFDSFLEMMRWDLVKRQVATENKMEVTLEDAKTEAKEMAAQQFRYYGMGQVADDMLENYSEQILKNQEEAKKIYEKVGERKVVAKIIEQITLEDKKVSIEEFSEMIKK